MFGLFSTYFNSGQAVLEAIRSRAADNRWQEDEERYLAERSAWLTKEGRRIEEQAGASRRDLEEQYNFYYLLPLH